MFERIGVICLLFGIQAVWDRSMLKSMSAKEIVGYILLMLPVAYLAVFFVSGQDWPNYTDLLQFAFGKPANRIVDALKLPG
ncbi:MAG: hypothetical protein J7639_06190 [Paenibacillaceae bacterium]|nr:hypothetical protein [Paenibacillaceae bacterium]